MGAFITPKGTTVGQGWEYQIIQGSAATNWTPWSESLEFSTDPATNQPFQPGKLYWLVARNPDITLGLPGSITRPVAAGLEVTDSGRVQPASPDGLLPKVQTLSDLLGNATPDELDALLRAMLSVIKTPTKAALCAVNSGCGSTPTLSYPPVFRNFKHWKYTTDSEVLQPDYIVRIDGNTCGSGNGPGSISGWAFDKNHPTLTPFVRIKRDGVFAADQIATIDRPDVLTYLKGLGLAPQNQTFCKFGFGWDKPLDSATGQPITWTVFGGNTTTESTTDVGAPKTTTCGSVSVTPTNNFRRTGSISTIEGQTTQLGIERKNSDESWSGVLNSQITWSTVGASSGISLPSSGVFGVAADSLSANENVEVHAAIGDYVFSFIQQALNTDCSRPGSLPTYILAWNYTPTGGSTRLFSSLQDAINTVSAKLDNSAPGTISTFGVNAASIAVGQTVYNGTGLSCETVSDGIYYVFANGQTDTIKKAITVTGGVITAVQDSTYQGCTAHTELTDEQRDALTEVLIYEYADPSTPNGPLSFTVRAFATRQEAMQLYASNSHVNHDYVHITTPYAAIGDVMYGSNKVADVQAGKAYNRPAEKGYWILPSKVVGDNSYILYQTNACGEIIGRETINPAGS